VKATRGYTGFAGVFLLLQGLSTLAFRLIPAWDAAFPALLATTHMMPLHSSLHIVTGVLALWVLARGGARGPWWFAAGFGAFYMGLAAVGFATQRPTIFELQPFDHPFHLALGLVGLAIAAGTHRSTFGKAP
jgi:hypothetical protein